MRLIFMGTPEFAASTLGALQTAGHDVVCVYTQQPRPAGRGMAERISPVHGFAQLHGIEVRTPVSLKSASEQERFAGLKADAAVVVAYGLLLPKAILEAPKLGCFNVHASLLPRWRGAAPIQRAIMAGDTQSGVTIMRMNEGAYGDCDMCGKPIPLQRLQAVPYVTDCIACRRKAEDNTSAGPVSWNRVFDNAQADRV